MENDPYTIFAMGLPLHLFFCPSDKHLFRSPAMKDNSEQLPSTIMGFALVGEVIIIACYQDEALLIAELNKLVDGGHLDYLTYGPEDEFYQKVLEAM